MSSSPDSPPLYNLPRPPSTGSCSTPEGGRGRVLALWLAEEVLVAEEEVTFVSCILAQ